MTTPCAFCSLIANGETSHSAQWAVAFPDGFPLNPGHTLVVPLRHVGDLAELTVEERDDLWRLVNAVQLHISNVYHPDGFNIGVNIGIAAGQTIEHAHIHVIPRILGDVPDPKGGVRWVIPDRAPYWADS